MAVENSGSGSLSNTEIGMVDDAKPMTISDAYAMNTANVYISKAYFHSEV
jgi:hypothetical protein